MAATRVDVWHSRDPLALWSSGLSGASEGLRVEILKLRLWLEESLGLGGDPPHLADEASFVMTKRRTTRAA